MAIKGTKTIGSIVILDIDSFPDFSAALGSMALKSDGNVYLKTGSNDEDWEPIQSVYGLALFAGGEESGGRTSVIEQVIIATKGNSTSVGNLTTVRFTYGCSSQIRAVFGGGWGVTTGTGVNTMDYLSIESKGLALSFGVLTQARAMCASCSNHIRGVWSGGLQGATAYNIIDYCTLATTGNALDFGDLSGLRINLSALASPTRGIFGGGSIVGLLNYMDYITFSTTGNVTSFGNLSTVITRLAGCSSATRGLWAGGYNGSAYVSTIEYVTLATTGNTTNFGNLITARQQISATSSPTRALFGGGEDGTFYNDIEYVTPAHTGSSNDFGNLGAPRYIIAAVSNGHGGL